MDETIYFNKGNIRITNLPVSNKRGNVLVRDISAVHLKSPVSARFFETMATLFFGLVAASLSQSGRPDLMLVSIVVAIIWLVSAFIGRDVIVTTHGGNEFEAASALAGEMREIKDAISRAMTT